MRAGIVSLVHERGATTPVARTDRTGIELLGVDAMVVGLTARLATLQRQRWAWAAVAFVAGLAVGRW